MSAPLTVVSWNVRKAVGLDWRRDPARIVRLLAAMAPDIVFLQEADKRVPPRPAAIPDGMLREIGLTPVPAPGAGIGWHGNAILLGPRVTYDDVDALDLPGLEPRGALLARLSTPLGPLTVGGMHLGLTRGARRRQIGALRDRFAGTDASVLLGGDCNEWSRTRGFEPLGADWTVHAPGPTFHAAFPVVAFDRFLTRGTLSLRDCEVADDDALRVASDHLPIRAELVTR